MRRLLTLLPFLMLLVSVTVVAQTVTEVIENPEGNWADYVKKMVELVITLGGPAISPWISKRLIMFGLMAIGKAKVAVPENALVFISGIMSTVFAGIMGATTDVPLHGDSAAVAGGIIGTTSQKLAHKEPEDIKPTPAAMKEEAKQEKKKGD